MKALLPLLTVILILSCNSNTPKQDIVVAKDYNQHKSISSDTSLIDKDGGIPIFYNMYLSVEMSSLFKSIGATYNPKILNSSDKVNSYTISTDKALNLGVYAVSLCYTKYFDQVELATKYLKSMHKLSTDLGIPDDKFIISKKRIENNLSSKDSLIKIANELYTNTETYLRENERESSAAFVIAGGWTEAMYIAFNLINAGEKNTELLERIAEQKQSLNNLIDLLKKYDKELPVKEFLPKLLDLKTSFDKLDITNMNSSNKILSEIGIKISSLRKDIIN